MPFIISAGTTVSFGSGIQSVNLNMSPQIQRLYALGSIVPFDKNIIEQHSLSITKYSGQGGSYDLSASTGCDDASSISISISADGCGGGISASHQFYITSYSYNKDAQGWGMESFSFITKPIPQGGIAPRMIRGVAEGSASTDGGANPGVSFYTGTGYSTVNGQSIEVTAGSPGIGRASDLIFGEVQSVGGGTGKADGLVGTANVSVSYAPIYIP